MEDKTPKEIENESLEILRVRIPDFHKVLSALVKLEKAEPNKFKLALSFLKKYM